LVIRRKGREGMFEGEKKTDIWGEKKNKPWVVSQDLKLANQPQKPRQRHAHSIFNIGEKKVGKKWENARARPPIGRGGEEKPEKAGCWGQDTSRGGEDWGNLPTIPKRHAKIGKGERKTQAHAQ